ncbi:MAG: hypothetical protein KIT02_15035 [Devosia sp.]|uniref:hypothetical protein n=1 Tax=Devosia sp. TaxID=1871048 RepID=UPI0024C9C927|nr:hypothetical protein [Devosia sp.]UYN99218.1 MAG: hypothetical protein KIT02_15035 [Devosia sp.]
MPEPKPAATNWWFVAAATLSLATAAIHVLAGAPEIMAPLLSSAVPVMVKGVVDVLWHHVTGLLLLAALACFWAARHPGWRLPVLMVVGGQFLLIALLFIVLGLNWFASLWPMPQWVLFAAMLGLMAMGARGRNAVAQSISP